MGVVQLGAGAEHHHPRRVQDLAFIEAVETLRRLRDTRLALGAVGQHEVPRLGIGGRRAEAQQALDVGGLRGSQAE
ncbi:hypothetical protein D3C72_2144440 [compost metagenome]